MKQVNFKELNVEVEIDQFQQMDLRADIGNSIHRQAVTIPMADLARKIFHSEGPVDMDDENYNMLISVLERSFALLISAAVKRDTIEIEEIKEHKEKKGK